MKIEDYFKQYQDIKIEVEHLERELKRSENIDNGLSEILTNKIEKRNKIRKKIETLLDELPPRDSCIIRLFYINGYSAIKTANQTLMSERQFYREKKRILQNLQERFNLMQESS